MPLVHPCQQRPPRRRTNRRPAIMIEQLDPVRRHGIDMRGQLASRTLRFPQILVKYAHIAISQAIARMNTTLGFNCSALQAAEGKSLPTFQPRGRKEGEGACRVIMIYRYEIQKGFFLESTDLLILETLSNARRTCTLLQHNGLRTALGSRSRARRLPAIGIH